MTTITATTPVLDDVLVLGLQIVFCGTAVGRTSARLGSYYAGPGNKFWATLHATGLTPRQLQPDEFRDLPRYRIGLTDVCKQVSGNDRDLNATDFDPDGFWRRLNHYSPQIIAFNGKQAAKAAMHLTTVDYGLQSALVHGIAVYVLPSTSAAARGYWSITPWHELAAHAKLSCATPAPARRPQQAGVPGVCQHDEPHLGRTETRTGPAHAGARSVSMRGRRCGGRFDDRPRNQRGRPPRDG